jgi:hypothetical protein
MMEIYNINGALRGSPPPGVTAGNAIATLTTNAIEFSQNFTKSYIDALEMAMTYAIYNFHNFASPELVVSAEGPNGSTIAKKFKTSDLASISRVDCKIANPLMATSAGKFEVAQNLLQMGLIKNPKKYFEILEGAPAEVLWDEDYNQDAFIQQENDYMREKKPVMAMMTDDHAKHIACHASLMNDSEIRQRSDILEGITAHIKTHYGLLQSQDPMLAQIIKTGQAPQMPPPGPMPGKPPQAPTPSNVDSGAPGENIKRPGEANPAKPGVDLGALSQLAPKPPGLR